MVQRGLPPLATTDCAPPNGSWPPRYAASQGDFGRARADDALAPATHAKVACTRRLVYGSLDLQLREESARRQEPGRRKGRAGPFALQASGARKGTGSPLRTQ